MNSTEKYLTLSKYGKVDKEASDVAGLLEEERRSKAYSKIINQQSDATLVSKAADIVSKTLNLPLEGDGQQPRHSHRHLHEHGRFQRKDSSGHQQGDAL